MRSIPISLAGLLLALPAVSMAGESLVNGSFEDGTNNGWIIWAQTWGTGQTWYHDPPAETDVCGHGLTAPDGRYFGGISYLKGTTPDFQGHVLYRQPLEVKNWHPEADRVNYDLELWAQVAHSAQYTGYETRQEHILWWALDGEMPHDTAFVRIGNTVADGDTIEIDTGGVNRVYEFSTDGVLRDPANVLVDVSAAGGGAGVANAKTKLAMAINDDASAPCTASVGSKVVVLLWKETYANGATNTNLNDAGNVIEVTNFSTLPGTPQYETNQDKQYDENVPMKRVVLTQLKTTFFVTRNDANEVNQCFTNWRKIKLSGSVPGNPKVVVLEIRLKTDSRLTNLHNLFDGVVFSATASTGSLMGKFEGDIPNSDFEDPPYNTQHHGDKTGIRYDPPSGWGDRPPPPPEGYRNYLRDWGRDGATRGPVEGYTNPGTEPPPLPHGTDPLGAFTPSGTHFWGRANPGGENGTGVQGYWGHVVPIRNWSPCATGLRFKLRYLTLMKDNAGSQIMELCWGDTAWAKQAGNPNPATRSILEQPTDALNFDLLQSYQVPWMKIIDFSTALIGDVCATKGFVEIERTGEFSPTDLNGAASCPQYILLRNSTLSSTATLPFSHFYDMVDFYAEAVVPTDVRIVTQSPLPAAVCDSLYNLQLIGCYVEPLRFSVASGNLPPGLKLSPNGLISGQPNTAGTFAFTVQLEDGASATATKTFEITVNGNCCGPVRGDLDRDADVDQRDFALMQLCYTDSDGGIPMPPDDPDCTCADLDADGVDIDQADLLVFEQCASGPGVPANPQCSMEACCLTEGKCVEILPGTCRNLDGVPQGVGTTCETTSCP
ncbi:MAG TPA: Ig domain-containing protein [Phycisphaerae bacterium]|nr:Ig domain-containing protein [Phycisphaerae bacterium]HRR84685.1 Ig domain-containing protein [Phycisphaerae bacterium]